ncbi:MAG: prepilin-type N-terminal cleavage/methylation domain-containing protein [Phycisphaerales bacterium]
MTRERGHMGMWLSQASGARARSAPGAGNGGRESRGRGRGFTLVELLVAAAAVVIVAVGIAQVFRVTGTTVSSGRKISAITTYAAAIERQLRTDFASMTREGFLLIRSSGVDANGDLQFDPSRVGATSPDVVRLSSFDQEPRSRRADEIMFFAKGDFTTVREPRYPTRVAKSAEARIYYGHGRRRATAFQAFGETSLSLSDNNSLMPLAFPPNGGTDFFGIPLGLGVDFPGNPNRYAADWVLVRHVALLAPPAGVDQDSILATAIGPLPPSLVAALGANLRDSEYQVALQPAAPSLFRRLNDVAFLPGPFDMSRPAPGAPIGPEVPYFSSGIVDLATTTLSEIRSIVLGAKSPQAFTTVGERIELLPYQGPANPPLLNPPDPLPEMVTLERMQRWMLQAMPTDSDGVDTNPPFAPVIGLDRRIRAELAPPNFVGFPGSEDYDRADQLALAASVFVPGCSEFIVEWSFGETDTDPQSPTRGRTIWYGQERLVDVSQDGSLPPTPGSPATDNFVNYWIRPFPGYDTNRPATDAFNRQKTIEVARRDGSTFRRPIARALIHPDPYFLPAYRYNPAAPPGQGLYPMYSLFGYVDPTYAPLTPLGEIELGRRGLTGVVPRDGDTVADLAEIGYVLVLDRDGDGIYDVDPSDPMRTDTIKSALLKDVNRNGEFDGPDGDILLEPDTVPCPWPKLIRITMSIADATDPTFEREYQFILPVPPPAKTTNY